MFCPKCGNQIPDTAAFCPKCGVSLSSRKSPAAPTPPEPPAPPAPNAEHTPAAQGQYATATQVRPAQKRDESAKKGAGKAGGKTVLIAAAAVVAILAVALLPNLFSSKDDDTPSRNGASGTVVSPPPDATSTPEQPSPSPEADEGAASAAQTASRTVMVYMIGSTLEYDNQLVGLASMDIEEMRSATQSDNVNIIIQTGGTEKWENPAIKGGTVQRFKLDKNGLDELEDLGQVCMTKESTLSEFIKFAKSGYPAEEYVLVLWDHGGGVPNGFGQDVYYPDEILSDVEIGKALKMGGVHFDLVAFDACLMCSLEVYMSIKDYADYAVAAESLVAGRGLNYETFINELNDTGRSIADCGSILVDDYIDFLKSVKDTGTMSVVRLDKIQDVYSAYVKYIAACYRDLQGGDAAYQEIMKARDNCGDFSGYDFVDLNMLATQYDKGGESTALHNAITNSVVYTKSHGYTNGLGVTAYFPYELAWLYDNGRASLVELDYDTSVIGFYDLLASRQLYYGGLTQYAGDWYVKPEGSQQGGQTYQLNVTQSGGHMVVPLTEEEWDVIYAPSCKLVCMDEDGLLNFGFDNIFTRDNNGYLMLVMPDSWLHFGSIIPTSQLITVSSGDDGSSTFKYFVTAYVDDEPALIQVNYLDGSGQSPTIVGYYLCDFDKLDFYDLDLTALDRDGGHYFQGSEQVELVAVGVGDDDEVIKWYYDAIAASSLKPGFSAVDTSDYSEAWVSYSFDDVYGNSYFTEYVSVK